MKSSHAILLYTIQIMLTKQMLMKAKVNKNVLFFQSGDSLGGLTVTLGLCLPSTCSEEEIISAVQSIFDNSKLTSG